MEGVRASALELSLSLKPFYVPKTIANLLKDVRDVDDMWAKLSLLGEYLQEHKEELARIEPLRGELPQSTLLLLESIDILEEEIEKIKKMEPESKRPLVEFPTEKIRRTNGEEERLVLEYSGEKRPTSSDSTLCSLDHHLDSAPRSQPCKLRGKERGKETANGSGGSPVPPKTRIPRTEDGDGSLNLQASDQTLDHGAKPLSRPVRKNNRMTWTWELHARFIDALNFLGGPEEATPKQIIEVMQVEGLTNDQVKSHLQKHRLYQKILNPMIVQTADSEVSSDFACFQSPYPLRR